MQNPESRIGINAASLTGTRVSTETRQLLSSLVIVLLVAIAGLVLALQGWRSRIPATDMLTYFNSAETLLKTGTPARYGDVSSYGAFSPPGTTWFMAPGMLFFDDARLYEKFGSGLLHLATLLGVFLLARASLGIWCAYFSVLLYGFSGLGLSFAGSLWPIGHPVFYVWMVYFAIQWVTLKDAKYFAAAVAVWAVGMYDDMAITPSVLVLPALWLIYRPPLFSRFHLLAAALALVVWYPYLEFEVGRDFADLRSLLLRENIFPTNYKETWCDPNLGMQYSNGASTPSLSDGYALRESQSAGSEFFDRLVGQGRRITHGVLANFNEVTPIAGISILLSLSVLATLIVLSVTTFQPHIGNLFISRIAVTTREIDQTRMVSFLLSLAIPWLILLFVAEPDRPERFFWVWPLQAIALAAFTTNIMARIPMPFPVRWLTRVAFIGAVLITPFESHLKLWLRNGWAGSDPEEVRVVDYVAGQLRSEGRDRVAIGYPIFIYEFMAKYAILDREYKVGAEFDFLFKHRHGVSNTNQCAEGLSSVDEYRIVQTRPKIGPEEPKHYFEVPLDKRFRLLRSFNLYQVFKRD
jgi:hypothetical protein